MMIAQEMALKIVFLISAFCAFLVSTLPLDADANAVVNADVLVNGVTLKEKDLGYELNSQTGHWYKFHKVGRLWEAAKKECEAEGALLATAKSKDEAQILSHILKNNMFENKSENIFWMAVGIKKKKGEDWRTIEGQTLEEAGFADWGDDFPLSGNYFDLYGFLNIQGKLLSFIDNETAFICQK